MYTSIAMFDQNVGFRSCLFWAFFCPEVGLGNVNKGFSKKSYAYSYIRKYDWANGSPTP